VKEIILDWNIEFIYVIFSCGYVVLVCIWYILFVGGKKEPIVCDLADKVLTL
jgi:hypothetical protein